MKVTLITVLMSLAMLASASAQSQNATEKTAPSTQEWVRSDAATAGLDPAALAKMEQVVSSGELKKITSVVIARGGKIVYEKYFEGDADSLRDTRSATKSITSMLTGIALERGAIPDRNAKVFRYFPDKQPVANPD